MRMDAEALALVEQERRRDRFIRRVCVGAWAATFLVLIVFAINTGVNVSVPARLAAVGAVDKREVYDAAMPLVIVLGILFLLIAVLATIGVFLRLRTASLTEIQLRLSALEAMLARQDDDDTSRRAGS